MASTIIIVAILAIICIIGAVSFFKRFNQGCCGAGDSDEKRIKITDKDPTHYPYSKELKIDGMKCHNCSNRVENALNSLDGVWAQVDLKSSLAKIRMKNQTDETELRRAVAKAGYTVVS